MELSTAYAEAMNQPRLASALISRRSAYSKTENFCIDHPVPTGFMQTAHFHVQNDANPFVAWSKTSLLDGQDIDRLFSPRLRPEDKEKLYTDPLYCPDAEQVKSFCKKVGVHPALLSDWHNNPASITPEPVIEVLMDMLADEKAWPKDKQIAVYALKAEEERFEINKTKYYCQYPEFRKIDNYINRMVVNANKGESLNISHVAVRSQSLSGDFRIEIYKDFLNREIRILNHEAFEAQRREERCKASIDKKVFELYDARDIEKHTQAVIDAVINCYTHTAENARKNGLPLEQLDFWMTQERMIANPENLYAEDYEDTFYKPRYLYPPLKANFEVEARLNGRKSGDIVSEFIYELQGYVHAKSAREVRQALVVQHQRELNELNSHLNTTEMSRVFLPLYRNHCLMEGFKGRQEMLALSDYVGVTIEGAMPQDEPVRGYLDYRPGL